MYMHVYNGRGVSWTLHVAGSYDRKSIYLTLLLPHTHTVHWNAKRQTQESLRWLKYLVGGGVWKTTKK